MGEGFGERSSSPRYAATDPYQASDLAAFVALNSDAEVRRHVGGPLTPAEATTRFQSFFSDGHDDAWATTLRESGQYIGHCWLVMREEDPELGFLLVQGLWRQGYGTEVAVALLDYALTQRCYSRVVATVDADHPASIGVLERAGMRRQCNRQDEHGVYFVYSAMRPTRSNLPSMEIPRNQWQLSAGTRKNPDTNAEGIAL